MNNEGLMCLQAFAPEDVFSKIVNRHHDQVRTRNIKSAHEAMRRRKHKRAVALMVAGAVVLAAIGFAIGVRVVILGIV